MKAVKSLVAALAVAAVITPAQADDRAVFGAVIAGVITYHVLKHNDEPRVVYQQPVYQQPQVIIVQPLRQPHCYLRQAYSAPGQGAVYVQECRY
jgi:hypothetical protein